MKTRGSLMLVSLALSLLLLSGCGETKGPESSKDGAKASVSASAAQFSSEVQKLAKELQPLIDESTVIHEGILGTIQKLGYQHISQDQAKDQINKLNTQNDALRQKVSKFSEVTPELNKAVEYLSTGVYLRQGHFKEIKSLLEQPTPKPSQFNNIIKQVKTDYSFTEKAQGELQALTNNQI